MREWTFVVAAVVTELLIAGCVNSSTETSARVARPEVKASAKTEAPATEVNHAAAGETPVARAQGPQHLTGECIVPRAGMAEPPLFLRSVVVTRIARACSTATGQHGYEKGTAWMAMGFPCTGGSGQVDWQGHYATPNIVTFAVNNACPMHPAEMKDVALLGPKEIGLDPTAAIVAYYPLAVQYWELVQFPDADTGYTISLRTVASLKDGWKRFRENKPLEVRLYGRENVWVKGGGMMFVADASIQQINQKAFKLTVTKVRVLTAEDADGIRKRCEDLSPQRNCREIFE